MFFVADHALPLRGVITLARFAVPIPEPIARATHGQFESLLAAAQCDLSILGISNVSPHRVDEFLTFNPVARPREPEVSAILATVPVLHWRTRNSTFAVKEQLHFPQ